LSRYDNCIFKKKKKEEKLGVLANAYNFSYLRGRDWKVRPDRTIMPPFYKSVAILTSDLTSWKMEPFPITALPFSKTSRAPRQAPPKLHPHQAPPVHVPTSYSPSSIKAMPVPDSLSSCTIVPRSARWLMPVIKPCPWM
jgi:hypothetical protein